MFNHMWAPGMVIVSRKSSSVNSIPTHTRAKVSTLTSLVPSIYITYSSPRYLQGLDKLL